jgi:hypothetical protein
MFRVPERARLRTHPRLGSSSADGNNGAFIVRSVEPGWDLALQVSDGMGWEHVSVHAFRGTQQRTPNWKEMCQVKDLCWEDEDAVLQYHPPRAEYVNDHPYTLHLWRPIGVDVPRPSLLLV